MTTKAADMTITKALAILIPALVLTAAGCGSGSGSGPLTDSESHFMSICMSDTDCGDEGLMCLCGVCTQVCETPDSACGLDTPSLCTPEAQLPDELFCASTIAADEGICLATCAVNSDCDTLRGEHVCVAGSCVPEPLVVEPDVGVPDAADVGDTAADTLEPDTGEPDVIDEPDAISFLSPLVTMALAALLLRERVGATKMAAAVLALAGAALVLRPGSDAFQAAGLLALAAAAFMGLEAVFIKRLADAEPPLRILLINNAIGAALALAVASKVWVWPSTAQWLLLATLGAVMVCGQVMFIQSMRRADASLVIPAFYSVLVFASLYDFVLFGVAPGGIALIGAGMIVAGALILARR